MTAKETELTISPERRDALNKYTVYSGLMLNAEVFINIYFKYIVF